jgi:diacylglycerol kinase
VPKTSPSPISANRRHTVPAAFRYAFAWLRAALRSERNLQIHLVLAALALVGAWLLRLPLLGWALVIFTIGLVVCAELLNSAIESVVDLVSPEDHALAKRAKDIGAAAVLVAALAAVAIAALLVAWAVGRL